MCHASNPPANLDISAPFVKPLPTRSPNVDENPLEPTSLSPTGENINFFKARKRTCVINVDYFASMLVDHPDQPLVAYIVDGLRNGFDIGFSGVFTETKPKNNKSALNNKEAVTKAIEKEIARGHTAGPFKEPPFQSVHCSPIGCVPKKDGTVRLVMDLSQPRGQAINEGIAKEDFAVQYSHFDDATKLVRDMGKDCLMSKLDIKHAYRLLPVRSDQWHLLAYFWEGNYYVDMVLPFGLRSSGGIFNHFANLVCWIINHKYGVTNLIHYSDDFFLVGAKDVALAEKELAIVKQAFQDMGIPLATDKIEGPSTEMIYLGILINSKDLTIAITPDRYSDITSVLPKWMSRRTCTKTEILSLIGVLSFVAKVVRPGRTFLRRLIDLSTTVKRQHHHITLNNESKCDIQWWIKCLPEWKSSSMIPEPGQILTADIQLYTDASDIGFGAVYGRRWIRGGWDAIRQDKCINYRELFAIVAATMTWGHEWKGKRIVFLTDNKTITHVWSSGTSPSPTLMSLIRPLFLTAAKGGFSIAFKHIYGIRNPIADALSRFQMAKFFRLMPDADTNPTDTPQLLWSC